MHANGLVLLFDGVCGLCHGAVQFVLARDRNDRFRFAALQSEKGRAILLRHGRDPTNLDTVYLVVDFDAPSERLLSRGAAAVAVLRELGRWRYLAAVLALLPTAWLDFAYDRVAARRYRWFGRYDTCPLPDPAVRRKFLDL
jgi:predicted DCC family thiol-disulfide oxidoreductase YuxK